VARCGGLAALINIQPVSSMPRGGARPGAGRPAGSENHDTAQARRALSDLAAGHVEVALGALAHIAAKGRSEAARVSAACAILDRAYGRPRQAVEVAGMVSPCPTRIEIVGVDPGAAAALDSIAARLSSAALSEIVAAHDALTADGGE
jgi:hypothetical protein